MGLRINKLETNYRGFPIGESDIDSMPWVKNTIRAALEAYSFVADGHIPPPSVDAIEYRARDGFIPHSHNKGGFDTNNFTDLYSLWGSGDVYTGKLGKEINERIELKLKDAKELFIEQHPEILFNNLAADDIDYNSLYDAGLGRYAEQLSEIERETLDGDYSTVMEQVRVIYHGVQNGVHSLTVFASVSFSDAPYHRSTDACEEQTITFVSLEQLKKKLDAALTLTSKVFE